MVKAFYQEDIIERLAALFTFGLEEGYSYTSIEEKVSSSSFVEELENNRYDIESKIERIVEKAYQLSLDGASADISFTGLFLAESYFRLFSWFNRSFEYLFLYWPLSSFLERYGVYHEMDFSNLRNDFLSRVKETPLLKMLAKARRIKLTDISKLTGINANTIEKYCQDDRYLSAASYQTIYKLATLFDVKETIFASNLSFYLDTTAYLHDKSNQDYRNYLGLYFASFFDHRIKEKEFAYDPKGDCFRSDGYVFKTYADRLDASLVSRIECSSNSKTYIVVMPSGFFGDISDFDCLREVDAFEVLVLTQDYVYLVKKHQKKEITDTVSRSLIIRAKEMVSYLAYRNAK